MQAALGGYCARNVHPEDLFFDHFDHAAWAISDTRSNVVACKPGRASIRASQATRFACGAASGERR
jgi:hypothetical protein